MDARQIITRLRDGEALHPSELAWFATGLADGTVTDAQAGAFAMAGLLQGFGEEGRVALTQAMRDSGQVLTWDLPGPVLDKHSTGGIGDCTSLLLAPALAACGAFVPMISGRGLGHTGGTLDKLEAIPGYRAEVPTNILRDVTAKCGCAIVSASEDIAPADKRLYGIRDVTGTVESIDLITASILSKKLAAGLNGLVLDVKTGSGAMMTSHKDAKELAQALVRTACGAGCPTSALISDMNQPLIRSAGNALELIEVLETLTGARVSQPLWDLTCALGGELLASAGIAPSFEEGAAQIARVLTSGAAAERFGMMVTAMGGPADFVSKWPDRLPSAPVMQPVLAGRAGTIQSIDGRALGMAVVHLGGGRLRGGDVINPAVGLSKIVRLGDAVSPDTPLAMIHAANDDDAHIAQKSVLASIQIGEAAPEPLPLIYERVG